MKATVLNLTLAATISSVLSTAPLPAVAAEASRIEEIIVTAERRAQASQDVGIALSVLTGDDLAEHGVDTVNKIQYSTPSLEVEPAFGSGQPQFRLRGVGFIDYTSNNTSPVGVSVDEVPLPFPIQTQGQLFDIARVEVLRGPQGTLYGRNTTAGAVNFISNRPTQETEAGFTLDYGSHDAFAGEGYLSGSITDSLRARLAVSTEQGGGWQRNRDTGEELGDKNKIAARGQLEFAPTDNLDFLLTVHASQDKSESNSLQLFTDFTSADGLTVIPADKSPYSVGWSLRPAFADAVGIPASSKPGVNNTNNGIDLKANVDFANFRLTSITAYNKLLRRELNDWDATSFVESDIYFRSEVKVFSQEVRLASTGTGPLGWVTGVYYSNEKLHEQFYGDFAQRLGGAALTQYDQDGEIFGVFAQGNYQFTDRLKGILGVRYEDESRDLKNLLTYFSVTDPIDYPNAFILNGGPASRSLSNSDFSGKLGLEFKLTDDALLYGSISRGVKSGGFTAHNTTSDNPVIVDPFKAEKLTAYEVGLKSEFIPGVQINASVFYYDYKDQQVLSKFFDEVSESYIGRFINAPKSKITGAEVELQWHPTDNLEIGQYLGYKEGEFTDTVLNSELVDFKGKDIDFPKLSYGGNLAYTWGLGSFNLRTETNYSYRDKYAQLFLLGPNFTVDSYWLVNASVSLTPQDGGPWEVALWGRNITNEKYYVTKNFFLPSANVAQAGQPTTVGIRVSYKTK